MKIGFIGLGKMGENMVKRLLKEHEVVVYDKNQELVNNLMQLGAFGVSSIETLVMELEPPRIIWLMIPSGEITENAIVKIFTLLSEDDVIIDGGNSYYKDSKRRANMLLEKKVHFLDVGTSGGLRGLEKGYCLMVGGRKDIYEKLIPVFETLSVDNGYSHVGCEGAGHYVKMIHNGIEYALMQAYAEGFELIKSKKEYNIDCELVAKLWNRGSVIRSWLLELIENVLKKDAGLDNVNPFVEDSGEGRWTVTESVKEGIPAPLITLSLFERFASRIDNSFGKRLLASLRNEFGGHSIKKRSG